MTIPVYTSDMEIKKWITSAVDTISDISSISFRFHNEIHSFKNEIKNFSIKKTIVLVDIDTLEKSIIKALFHENIKMIAISKCQDIKQILNIYKLNFDGFICAFSNHYEILNCIFNFENNFNFYIDEKLKNKMLKYLISNHTINDFGITTNEHEINKNIINTKSLNQKEMEICKLIIQGLTYKSISSIMGLKQSTINQKAKYIFQKMNVKSRAELSYLFLNKNYN